MSASDGPLTGTMVGRYRVGPLLGRGGMGDVYRAEDPELRRPVALKVLPDSVATDPDRLTRFVHEARAASALNHPHLVAIYEIGEHREPGAPRGVNYIAMELVSGATLRELIATRRLDRRKALDVAAQAADAIAAAHAEGIIHRDIKPENVMVAEGGYAKVLDFGLAKLRAPGAYEPDGPTVSAGTAPGLVMGTVGYMSPEQAQGLPLDHRSDIFSFGCMLYEALSGAQPFRGRSNVETLHRIITEQPPAISSVVPDASPDLQRIVRKCLAKLPEERYQSMKEVAIDLRDVRRELDSGSTTSVAAAAAAPKRGRAWLVATAVLVLAAATAAFLYLGGRRTANPSAPLQVERITASGTVIDATVSADGKYVAYVESVAGKQTLWVRQLSGTRPLQLASTSGGFWGIRFSTDGTSIYYSIKGPEYPVGRLFAVPILGESPRVVLDGIDTAVSFSPDGRQFAFLRVEPSGDGSSSLVIAAADGSGERTLVTKHAPEFLAPGFFLAPAWSPDGTLIAAGVRNAESRESSLVTFAVADGAERVLPPRFLEITFTQWMPDGSGIVFVARAASVVGATLGGQLWLQPFPDGPARRITTDVIDYRTASVTADGGSLLTVGFEATGRLSTLTLGDLVERPIESDRFDGTGGVAWVNGGARVLYTHVVRNELRLWSRNSDGTDPREVVARVRPNTVAASLDGSLIVYGAVDGKDVRLWRARPDGSEARPLLAVPDAGWVTISPDARWVYFTSSMQGSASTFRVSIDGGAPVLVAPLFERAVLSRDGRKMAGVYRQSMTAPVSLAVLDAETGKPLVVFPNFGVQSGGGGMAFAPDGQSVLYTTSERMNVWQRSLSGGEPVKLTNFADLAIARWQLSLDGTSLLLSRGTMVRDAVLISNFR